MATLHTKIVLTFSFFCGKLGWTAEHVLPLFMDVAHSSDNCDFVGRARHAAINGSLRLVAALRFRAVTETVQLGYAVK